MTKENTEIEIKDLWTKLDQLTGVDFEEVEREEIVAGNKAADVTFTRPYFIRLAARALKCSPLDLKKMPLLTYQAIARQVSNFLFSGLGRDKILFNLPDNSASDFTTLQE